MFLFKNMKFNNCINIDITINIIQIKNNKKNYNKLKKKTFKFFLKNNKKNCNILINKKNFQILIKLDIKITKTLI